jgi:hypothetical protein
MGEIGDVVAQDEGQQSRPPSPMGEERAVSSDISLETTVDSPDFYKFLDFLGFPGFHLCRFEA